MRASAEADYTMRGGVQKQLFSPAAGRRMSRGSLSLLPF